ncbi:glycosyl transferase, group 1 [Candidatus Koribacter versatilis Ellin345]|uniref:Glycosyl transferase, group 1 n=1 Tax=Koribacter versatilis (strain Ellin345) TaxID=204669 RepID=Q1IJX7_KORVE|nr:glycosyltransferase family 4 protein [Candidatus Koribacter versatilis]ABF42823.1 glycosyl transferase, group 1 [Candidatus Koribacter versatilis Ellin345]
MFSDIEHEPIGNVRFVTGPKYERKTAARRFKTWFKYCWQATRLAFRTKGDPKLFIVAQPPFLSLLGYLQKKLMGRRYFLWIDDVWPDIIVGQKMREGSSWGIRLWAGFNRVTFRHAEHVFTLGPYMRDKVRQYVPENIPITIIPTWVDIDSIRPIPKEQNPFAAEHGLGDKLTVLYSGNLGLTHDIQSILEAARILRNEVSLHFMIIGAGPQWDSIERSIKEHQDANVTLLPLQPIDVLPFSLATADIAIASLEQGIEGVSMPSKTYYSMAAGSAIVGICETNSDLAHVVLSNQCGGVVRPKSPEALAELILRMATDREQLGRLRENARHAAVNCYSRSANTPKLRAILEGKVEPVAQGQS